MYVKLIECQIEQAPVNKDGICNYNLDVERMIADGYKLFIPAEVPPDTEIRIYHFEYVENTDNITEIVVYDETIEEAQERVLTDAKREKTKEALNKAYDYEQNGMVEYKNCVFEMSLSNRQNLKDTVDALVAIGKTSTEWNDKNDEIVVLSIEDIENIRLNLILGNIQKTWIEKYPAYLKQINEAKTVEEVNNITINY